MNMFGDMLTKNREWGDGDWVNEPGLYEPQWFEYKGYSCVAYRNYHGSWCGYVKIPNTSKFSCNDDDIDVHGGITYSGNSLPFEDKEEADFTWIGFDCGHFDDYQPRSEKITMTLVDAAPGDLQDKYFQLKRKMESWQLKKYRTLEFVKDECSKIVDQVEVGND